MPDAIANVLRGALLTALYFAGAVIAVLYLRTPADVTLFWPAAGIGYAFVLRYGLRYAIGIPIAQLLLHLVMVPVPLAFLPFSISSNFIGTLVACAYVLRRRPRLQLRIADGFLLMRGGVLLCLVSALVGTEYASDYRHGILFLEEVNEAPYRIDRMLMQLQLNRGLEQAAGVMFGICENCGPTDNEVSLTLDETTDQHLKLLKAPAVTGYSFGHIRNQFTLPMGIRARLDTERQTLTLLEPAVT